MLHILYKILGRVSVISDLQGIDFVLLYQRPEPVVAIVIVHKIVTAQCKDAALRIRRIRQSVPLGGLLQLLGREKEMRQHIQLAVFLNDRHDEELAEELAQDTFFKAMKSYENFRGDCKITTWLCQIAKHSFFLYEKHRKRNIDLNSVENEIVDTNSIEILLGQREQAFGIHKLLHNLPEPYKEVFSLRVLGELSYQDIAKLFGKTESWARVTFHRAKLKIIEQVKEESYE